MRFVHLTFGSQSIPTLTEVGSELSLPLYPILTEPLYELLILGSTVMFTPLKILQQKSRLFWAAHSGVRYFLVHYANEPPLSGRSLK